MSMNIGEGDGIDASTMRGRDWPCLRQFCVFMENRVGRLHELLRHLEGHDLRVIALSIADSVDCAIARLMVDNYERCREILKLTNFTVSERDLIGVELPEDPQPYLKVCTALLQAEVNIHYTYPLLYRRRGRSAIALFVDDIEMGMHILRDAGHILIGENDLQDDDEEFLS